MDIGVTSAVCYFGISPNVSIIWTVTVTRMTRGSRQTNAWLTQYEEHAAFSNEKTHFCEAFVRPSEVRLHDTFEMHFSCVDSHCVNQPGNPNFHQKLNDWNYVGKTVPFTNENVYKTTFKRGMYQYLLFSYIGLYTNRNVSNLWYTIPSIYYCSLSFIAKLNQI